MLHVKFVPSNENVSLYYINFFILLWWLKTVGMADQHALHARVCLNFETIYLYSGNWYERMLLNATSTPQLLISFV
jgi:hypothetical protein